MSLYFAYGSNLNASDVAAYCATHDLADGHLRLVGPAWLPDHRLAFTTWSNGRTGGVLDILPAIGHTVPGALFTVEHEAGWHMLDHKETTPTMYRRRDAVVLDDLGRSHPAQTYEVVPTRRHSFVAPAPAYLHVVRSGLSALAHGDAHLERAAQGDAAGEGLPLFVYGTLRRGEKNHQRLLATGARFLGSARVAGRVSDHAGNPGLRLEASAASVPGELHALPAEADQALAILDTFEGFRGHGAPGSLYHRVVVRADREDAGSCLAWTYIAALS